MSFMKAELLFLIFKYKYSYFPSLCLSFSLSLSHFLAVSIFLSLVSGVAVLGPGRVPSLILFILV